KAGRPGYPVLVKLAAAEDNPDVRKTLLDQIATQSSQAAQNLIADGQTDGAEELLEIGLAGGQETAVRNYAALLLLRGTLEDKIRQYRNQPAKAGDKQAAEILVYLYRARGDLADARRAAEQAGKPGLLEAILVEQGDWKALAKELAKKPDQAPPPGEAAAPALKATCFRLAGDSAACETELHKLAGLEGWSSAEALFFNDRPQEAIAALVAAKRFAAAFEFLTIQLKFHEAFALVDKAREAAPGDDFSKSELLSLEIHQARVLYQLGDKGPAQDIFARLGKQLQTEQNKRPFAALLEAEYQLDLKDQALAHAAILLASLANDDNPGWVLAEVFPNQKEEAVLWWKFLRGKYSEEKPEGVLKRLREVLEPKKGDKNLLALVQEAAHDADQLKPEEQVEWLPALAETCVALGREDLAQTYLEKAAGLTDTRQASSEWKNPAILRLADFLAEHKRWKEAAEWYNQAWDKNKVQAVPLYLRGWALAQAGRETEGKKLMERAHWLPLGNDQARYELAEALAKRGLTDAAHGERDFILRTGAFQSVYLTNMQNRVESEALNRKDYFQAATCCDRVMLAVLETGAAFVKPRSYLVVPLQAHVFRAGGYLAGGQWDEAAREVQLAEKTIPGDVDLPIFLVPQLEKAARTPEADHLFGQALEAHEKLCRDYPGSAWCHNSLAWLTARCRRQLDKGLEHARKAVELAPDNAGYRDTLAEVQFQRGEKDRAIESMKKCLELEPKSEYFQKQLKRFEAGNPLADLPEN
ncbi:MAG: hypothetical protein JO112_13550, partial [Planctomycetes bacterium]|nr:hypothetical protein [Planctomycetota bacterium]